MPDASKNVNTKAGKDYPKNPHSDAPEKPSKNKYDRPDKPATNKGGFAE